uniref:Uncharacterized protein n=1 Tax=Amphimedon queenslandica TaxID=400682 RepID=A0A1X7SPA2_AMPQE
MPLREAYSIEENEEQLCGNQDDTNLPFREECGIDENKEQLCGYQDYANMPLSEECSIEENEEQLCEDQDEESLQQDKSNEEPASLSVSSTSENFLYHYTPWRRDAIKHIAKMHNTSFCSSAVASSFTSVKIWKELVRTVKKEMKEYCSEAHDSILRDSMDGI